MKAKICTTDKRYAVEIWLGNTKEDVYGATYEEAKELYNTLGIALNAYENSK